MPEPSVPFDYDSVELSADVAEMRPDAGEPRPEASALAAYLRKLVERSQKLNPRSIGRLVLADAYIFGLLDLTQAQLAKLCGFAGKQGAGNLLKRRAGYLGMRRRGRSA